MFPFVNLFRKIDDETERLFPSLFATFDEAERLIVETKLNNLKTIRSDQGFNARKVISEVYAYFVLQCTVSGR